MTIGEWYDVLQAAENRLTNSINKFLPSKVDEFYMACRNKQDSKIHKILHETWFRNQNKSFGPDGWEVLCDLVSNYPK